MQYQSHRSFATHPLFKKKKIKIKNIARQCQHHQHWIWSTKINNNDMRSVCAQIKMCILNRIKRIHNAVPTFCSPLLLCTTTTILQSIHIWLTIATNFCSFFNVTFFGHVLHFFFHWGTHAPRVSIRWSACDLNTAKEKRRTIFEACVLRAILSNHSTNKIIRLAYGSCISSPWFSSHSLDQLMLLHPFLSHSYLYVWVSLCVCVDGQ